MPNHSTPMITIDTHSRLVGVGSPLDSATADRHRAPIRSRPSDSAPGEKSSPR